MPRARSSGVAQVEIVIQPRVASLPGWPGTSARCARSDFAERNETLEKSARNIDRTKLTTVAKLNAWDILQHRTLLLTRSGLEQLLA